MSPFAINNGFLYKHRAYFSGVLLLIVVYFIVFSRLGLPPLGMFLAWNSERQLVVLPTIEEAYRSVVQPGDIVLAVDDQPVKRGDLIFPFPVQSVYEFTLQRGNDVFRQEITVVDSSFFHVWELSKNVLAFLIWFLGFLMAQFARPTQTPAVIMGLSFQLIAAGIISPGPTQLGAPGAWLVGYVLIFYFPLIILYASFMPRYKPLSDGVQRILSGSFILLTGLALAAAIEQLFLFPERSLADLLGLESQTILTILTGVSLVTAVIILLIRVLRLPKLSYERQQLTILLVFLVLAVSPLFFFVILPATAVTFAPFPVIYSFFLLAPAGYFFVFHRQGHLMLDTVFSQIVTVCVLILAVIIAYSTGAFLFNTLFQQDLSNLGQGAFALALFGVAIGGQKPVQAYVDLLIYGRYIPGDEVLREAKTHLSASPESVTITGVLARIAALLQLSQTAVLVKQANQFAWLAGNTPDFIAPITAGAGLRLRSRTPDGLKDLPDWVELSLPVVTGDEVIGLFLLAAPINGYFNSRQVELLQNFADILAFSLMVIGLVETMHTLSQKSLYERELQRQQIATEIHNQPLYLLTNFMRQLEQTDGLMEASETARIIRQVTEDLRHILAGLRPRILAESLHWIARQVIRSFAESHEDMDVQWHLDKDNSPDIAEPVKMAFYHILTESLNNIDKHSHASHVTVTMRCGDSLTLIVEDDGRGPGEAVQPLPELLRNLHLGVVDMHRWARLVGGKIEISEGNTGGTVVFFTLPQAACEVDPVTM